MDKSAQIMFAVLIAIVLGSHIFTYNELNKETEQTGAIEVPEFPEEVGVTDNALHRFGQIVSQYCPESKASCSCGEGRTYDACHLPQSIRDLPSELMIVTGYSNIPSMFMGNQIKTVKVKESDSLYVGCFYLFEYDGMDYVHRLMGLYPEYAAFRGDNNDGIEKVPYENIKRLVTGIRFT